MVYYAILSITRYNCLIRISDPERWPVLIKDHVPAYISWERYEANLEQMKKNQNTALGVPRFGPSLLSGLLICGHCGLHMRSNYSNSGRELRYACHRMSSDYGLPACQSLTGNPLDDLLSQLVLRALEPAALEISLQVSDDLETQRHQLHQQWQKRLERARYQCERAARQYHAVEPENRLVARTLEQQWGQALAEEMTLKEDYQRFLSTQPSMLSADERESIQRLASDIPLLWQAPTTTSQDRQAIIRQLVECIVVTVRGDSERVDIQVHWHGGCESHHLLIRPVARWDQLSYYPALLDKMIDLHHQGVSNVEIANQLNRERWRPAKRCHQFSSNMVGVLLRRQGLFSNRHSPREIADRRDNELTLPELAYRLKMPQPTLYAWLRKGRLQARKITSHSHPLWLVKVNESELQQLQALRMAAGQQQ